ncbi:P-loop containing nucleoside triphosphate hydrolase protein, partial [Coprinellus micaceus]
GYDSKKDWYFVGREFEKRFGKPAQPWQLDVAEAAGFLGLNTVVIAGTGAGKSTPFVLPALKNRDVKVLLISPLKALQDDQAARFEALGVSSAVVNGDTWSDELQERLQGGQIQVILTSPEMCLLHDKFRAFLSDAALSNELAMVVIDEAHCILQWGGDFRKEYGQLSCLHAFFPTHIPFLTVSATLTPKALQDVQNNLGFEIDTAFSLNRGNDHPNITMLVQNIRSPTNYQAILPHVLATDGVPTLPSQLHKTIIFVNSVKSAQHCARWIRRQLPRRLQGCIDVLRAQRTVALRRRVMKDYREGRVRVLIATEAAGMAFLLTHLQGCDIPDIELIIQLGVSPSLTVWIQRAGRAARSLTLHGRAILMVKPPVFQVVKKTDGIRTEYKKTVEPALRRWIETTGCRRDVVDEYFGNPPGQQGV